MKNKRNVAKQTYDLEKEISSIPPNQTTQARSNKQLTSAQQQAESEAFIHNDCLNCGLDITHPLCPNCLAKAFLTWSKKFPEHKELKAKLNPIMKHHNSQKAKSKPCVACGSSVHICPLCFTTHLHNLVKEAGLGVRATAQFLFIFNFDFEHKGYSQELEAYGGY